MAMKTPISYLLSNVIIMFRHLGTLKEEHPVY